MVVLGGVTRLTQSGLSMVEWEPIMGVVPPLDQRQWAEAFALYQQYPEYQQVNRGMGLDEFKRIFYVEYAHRMLGRGIGFAFAVPFLFFWLTGWLNRRLALQLSGTFLLGGLQGLLGWYMVQSGLFDQPRVSPYRLTAHLGLAVLIFSMLWWLALGLWCGRRAAVDPPPAAAGPLNWSVLAAAAVALMMLSGGFVAGTKAGFAFNTFPLMAGQWWPPGSWTMEPGWRNLFENLATVQFIHRLLALLVAAALLTLWVAVTRGTASPGARTGAHLMAGLLAVQLSLGIATLLHAVPVPLAAAHQAGALTLLAATLFVAHRLRHGALAAEPPPDSPMAARA